MIENDNGEFRAEVEAMAHAAEPVEVECPTPPVEPFKPFPVDALPEPFRGFVNVGAKAIGCDASYVALPLLAAAASAIGNTRRIQLKRGWTEPAIVWTAIVGDSALWVTEDDGLEGLMAFAPLLWAALGIPRIPPDSVELYSLVRNDLRAWRYALAGDTLFFVLRGAPARTR